MTQKTVRVGGGLEARNAALFVQAAGKFQSSVKLQVDNKTISAKSIMGVISLEIPEGSSLTIIADGKDEEQAAAALGRILEG
ncbi:MAG: HPr family phosphocarrier protein [Firmicutes bacterium]|nr:HPr family phosphocarrier protein [Bacillota bacterium]